MTRATKRSSRAVPTSTPHESERWQILEQQETGKRWESAVREIASVLARIQDIRRSAPEEPPAGVDTTYQERFFRALLSALLVEDRPELKRSVGRRMADKLGRYLLWNRISSTPAIHELGALLPWWMSQIPGPVVSQLRDIGLAYFLNGLVLPVQAVLRIIMEANKIYLGHCVCRSSGIVDDACYNAELVPMITEAEERMLLNRIMHTYARLKHMSLRKHTDARYVEIFEHLAALRAERSTAYRLQTLLDSFYPDWEFLPVSNDYTTNWIRSMHANRKARLLHKELAFELALILYAARGVIFTSMRLVDTPYAICSCPTPEHGGGCVLTNWYYWGMSNASVVPNATYYGRRMDRAGSMLPCAFFPIRAKRSCVGCGCNHRRKNPRSVRVLIEDAEKIRASCMRKE